MNFILENYLIIILVGLFFVFALIGYLIDMLRKDTNESNKEISSNVQPIEIANINTNIEEAIETPIQKVENNKDKADELLENYDKEITDKM